MDKEKIWHNLLESLKVSVSEAIYSTWLNQTHLASLKKRGNRYFAQIGCNSTYVKLTIQERYFGLIQDALINAINAPCDLEFIIKTKDSPSLFEASTKDTPLFDTERENNLLIESLQKANIQSIFTFDNYAVSGSNQMAYAAAQAVAQNPGGTYNPLFIWGGVGVGKTHLMNAIGYASLRSSPTKSVLFCTGEQFTNDIVEGIRSNTTQRFRDKYRKLNILVIDDIQFIAGKDKVQEEYFHTFNSVTGSSGQIIMASDRPPGEIAKLEARLRSRFEAGLVVDIAEPDFGLRSAIIQIKSQAKNIPLTPELIELIAANVSDARRIEGVLIRILSESKLRNTTVDQDLVLNIISKNGQIQKHQEAKNIHPDKIVDAVCNYYSISKRVIMGEIKARMVAQPRQILMYLLRTETQISLEEIGRIVGGRDHSTVMYAVDKIGKLATKNIKIREDISGIKSTFITIS